MRKKRIGVVGGGISGLTTAWLLKAIADVVVFEVSPEVGGHANTVLCQRGRAALDPSVLPRDRGAWSAWNYLRNVDTFGPTVTYDLNVVQGFSAKETYCVSLNETKLVRPESIIERFEYSHPRFFHGSFKAQESLAALSGNDRIHFAGAYTGMGFHEDGVRSATVVARRFGVDFG